MIYSTSSSDVEWQWSGTHLILCTSCHISHRVRLVGSYGSEGAQTESPHSECIHTLLTLQFPVSQLVFLFVSGNWINISSPNPQIICCVFSVLINDCQYAALTNLYSLHHNHQSMSGWCHFFTFFWPLETSSTQKASRLWMIGRWNGEMNIDCDYMWLY